MQLHTTVQLDELRCNYTLFRVVLVRTGVVRGIDPHVILTRIIIPKDRHPTYLNDIALRYRQGLPPTPLQPLRAALCRPFRPEGVLCHDVLRVAPAPLRHGSLVLLGDEEAALPPTVLRTVLVRDKTRRRGEILRLLAREDIVEVHLRRRPL